MVDISDDTKSVRRRAEVTGVVRRRRVSEVGDERVYRIVSPNTGQPVKTKSTRGAA
jgi:hypothetical protein